MVETVAHRIRQWLGYRPVGFQFTAKDVQLNLGFKPGQDTGAIAGFLSKEGREGNYITRTKSTELKRFVYTLVNYGIDSGGPRRQMATSLRRSPERHTEFSLPANALQSNEAIAAGTTAPLPTPLEEKLLKLAIDAEAISLELKSMDVLSSIPTEKLIAEIAKRIK